MMTRRFGRTWAAAAAVLAIAAAACAPTAAPPRAEAPAAPAAPAAKPAAQAEPGAAEGFFRGKTIKIVVGFAPGGGYDAYARLLGRQLGKHIPGNPSVLVENMPGAGSLLAANSVYNTAPKDGTTLIHFSGGLIVQQLIGNQGVQFDATKYGWVGAASPDTPACAVTRASGFNRLEEATGSRQLILGGTAPGSNDTDIPNTLRAALGLNLKVVGGYDGTAKIRLAAEGGETMGGCWAWESIKSTWKEGLASGDVKIIAQGTRAPHPDLPNVPVMRDLATTDEQRQLIDGGITLPADFARPFAVPPGVPPERVEALREGLMAALRDPELAAEAEKAQLALSPITGEQLEQSVKEVFALSPDLVAKLKAALAP